MVALARTWLLGCALLVAVVFTCGQSWALCKVCELDDEPCPAGGNACTADDPLEFTGLECGLVPGCENAALTNPAATCGQGDFAGCAPLGACCLPDGSCVSATQNLCAVNGLYGGDGTTCTGFECPAVGGACCSPIGGTCFAATEFLCESFGSVFRGDGTQCQDGTCGCCQCDCKTGGSCVSALAVGGCQTACAGIGCTFTAFATGDVCATDSSCVRRSQEGAPAASHQGLLIGVLGLLAVGSWSLLRRRR